MNQEIRIFFTALMYFTRIPCSKWADHSSEYLSQAFKYFPLIGWIVGTGSALVFWVSASVFPISICILLSMITSLLMTGAFHEDGLADVCDGFGGGWTKEKILEIMKDPRVGAFGVLGLITALSMKFLSLEYFAQNTKIFMLILITGHSLSRFIAVTFLYTHEYARSEEQSKSKALITKPSIKELGMASIFGMLPLFTLAIILKNEEVIFLIVPVYLVKILLGRFFKKWIGGYTGDCLGAAQQICEITFYLSCIALYGVL